MMRHHPNHSRMNPQGSSVHAETIRKRVTEINGGWNECERSVRALLGAIKRRQLHDVLLGKLQPHQVCKDVA